MLRLTGEQRKLLAEKFPDIGNMVAVALVFGQLLGRDPFSAKVAVIGFCAWAGCIVTAVWLVKRKP
jgi:hypothetical protein